MYKTRSVFQNSKITKTVFQQYYFVRNIIRIRITFDFLRTRESISKHKTHAIVRDTYLHFMKTVRTHGKKPKTTYRLLTI